MSKFAFKFVFSVTLWVEQLRTGLLKDIVAFISSEVPSVIGIVVEKTGELSLEKAKDIGKPKPRDVKLKSKDPGRYCSDDCL